MQEMERSKAEWVASRPKDYLAELSASRCSDSSRQSRLRVSPVRTTSEGEASPRTTLDGAVRGRPELSAPAFSIVSGDWLTSSHAFPADSMEGEELLMQLEARRTSRADYNRWVRDGSDPKALARLADEVRKINQDKEALGGDADKGNMSMSSTLANLEEVGYGYGDDFAMTTHGRERVEGAHYRGVKPRGVTPERMRRMVHGVHGVHAESGGGSIGAVEEIIRQREMDQVSPRDPKIGDRQRKTEDQVAAEEGAAEAVGAAADKDVEADTSDYRAELQTVLPSSQESKDSHRKPSILEIDDHSPPVPGETDIEAQLRCVPLQCQGVSHALSAVPQLHALLWLLQASALFYSSAFEPKQPRCLR